MTLYEGYRAMFDFLDSYYQKHQNDELASFLGGMSLLEDNSSADSVRIGDWQIAVSEVICQKECQELTRDSAYKAMTIYLRNWSKLGTDGSTLRLCENLEEQSSDCKEWQEIIKKVLAKQDNPYLQLKL